VPLVEGGDLTVRDDRLYLKTLYGLERVHGVIRRVDDAYCDPLELRADSALGVPGLIQAVRAGTVLIANSLGAAFLESPAIHGFLPAIAQRLLGEELLLAPRDSWWCGEAAARTLAFASLQTARVRATYRGSDNVPRIAARGTGLLALEKVRTQIEADPDLYTIQSYLPYSKTPCWSGHALVPRSAVMRVYAIAEGADRWHVMPGGLTRIAERQDEVSMQRGGSSADTWVVTGQPVDRFTMLADRLRAQDVVFRRRTVTSRAAENLYWLGRYTERADTGVRAARLILSTLQSSAALPQPVLGAIARAGLALGLVPPGVPAPDQGPRVFERTLLAGLGDPAAGSVAFDIAGIAGAASQIRDRMAFEHWRQITTSVERYLHALQRPAREPGTAAAAPPTVDHALVALAQLASGLAAMTGAQADGMTRDDGWRLLTVGRQVERLVSLARVLEAYFVDDAVLIEGGFDQLLGLFNSIVTYRSRYQGQRDIVALIDLLVLDAANPRSLAGTVELIGRELDELAQGTGRDAPWREAERFAGPRELLLVQLCARDDSGRFGRLIGLAQELAAAGADLSNRIGLRYFSHSEVQHSHQA